MGSIIVAFEKERSVSPYKEREGREGRGGINILFL